MGLTTAIKSFSFPSLINFEIFYRDECGLDYCTKVMACPWPRRDDIETGIVVPVTLRLRPINKTFCEFWFIQFDGDRYFDFGHGRIAFRYLPALIENPYFGMTLAISMKRPSGNPLKEKRLSELQILTI